MSTLHSDYDLRIEALRLAACIGEPVHIGVERAQAYFDFLSGKPLKGADQTARKDARKPRQGKRKGRV